MHCLVATIQISSKVKMNFVRIPCCCFIYVSIKMTKKKNALLLSNSVMCVTLPDIYIYIFFFTPYQLFPADPHGKAARTCSSGFT